MERREFLQLGSALAAGFVLHPSATAQDTPLFRIGIVGSDNSHAEAFAALLNLEDGLKGMRIPGAEVTHIWGEDPALTQDRATKGKIRHVAKKPEDMLGQVDGVICVRRHGKHHLADASPFLKAGIPVFVDKPLTASVADAEALLDISAQAKVGFTSFSTLRFTKTTQAFLEDARANIGDVRSGALSGPCDFESEYAGVFFYGIHSVELMLESFGYDCQSVRTTRHGGNAVALCRYPNEVLVTLTLLTQIKSEFNVSIFATKASRHHTVDSATTYFDGLGIVLDCMRTGEWPLTREQLLAPVKILAAIEKSAQSGEEVAISEMA